MKTCVVDFRLKGMTSGPRRATSAWRSRSAAYDITGRKTRAASAALSRCFVMANITIGTFAWEVR
ncbi:hypothetical protein D3C72_2464660 [compost metagenome]